MKGRNLKKVLITIVIAIAIFLAYNYLLEPKLANSKFDEYVDRQGVDSGNIETKKVAKNWKMGGQVITVKYSDDKECEYIYQYNIRTHKKNEKVRYHRMYLDVIKDGKVLDEYEYNECKYPPLEIE